jgi:NTE family protein/lysophospholipid hydrolase
VVTGRLEVRLSDTGGERAAGEVSAGEAVGEMGMLTGEMRSASVYAMRDSALVEFSTAFFDEISERYPDLLRGLTRLVIRRLRSVQAGVRPNRTAVQLGIFPLSRGLDAFGLRLADAIRRLGDSVLFVDGARFEEQVGIPGAARVPLDDPNDVRLRAWFDQQETRFDCIVYLADGEPTNWGRRVARHADHILLAAEAMDDPGLRPVETGLEPETRLIKRSLVLVHPPGSPASTSTDRWLAPRDLSRHYHLRSGDDAGLWRVARHLTRRATGVVLSGGGARGFAHIGVLRALDEAGIPIDFLSGVSAGALVAALYGIGLPYDEIAERFLALTRNVADFTLPMISMISGRKMARRIRTMFGDVRIEDLPIPVYCVSSNLSNATVHVHERGRLWEAVLASNTAVGFGPPVVLDGQLLMDGNALDNLPADVMAGILNGGPLIAVDVSTADDLALHPAPVTEGLSGWQVVWSRLNPWSEPIRLPSALDLIMRSQELSSLAQNKRFQDRYIDFYLEPPVAGYPVLAYKNGPELVRIGYDHARRKLDEWGEALTRVDGTSS